MTRSVVFGLVMSKMAFIVKRMCFNILPFLLECPRQRSWGAGKVMFLGNYSFTNFIIQLLFPLERVEP